jgi:hypothetical protein
MALKAIRVLENKVIQDPQVHQVYRVLKPVRLVSMELSDQLDLLDQLVKLDFRESHYLQLFLEYIIPVRLFQ